MYISKTKYKQLCQCPRQLWFHQHRPELLENDAAPCEDDPGLEEEYALDKVQTGILITEYSRELFGAYTNVTVLDDKELPDLDAMVLRTKECLNNGVETICEASFVYDGLYCAVDILHREKGGYAIYEVKSGTKIYKNDDKKKNTQEPPKVDETGEKNTRDVKEQFDIDIAFQKYILEHCGVNVTGVYIVTLDPNYVRGETMDRKALFKIHDMEKLIENAMSMIPERAALVKKTLTGSDPETPIGIHCFTPHECPFWQYCSAGLPEFSVFDLYRMPQKTKWQHYDNGYVTYQQLEQGFERNEYYEREKKRCGANSKEWKQLMKELDEGIKLNEKQKRQIRFELHDLGTHCDVPKIREFLNELSYPLYFLDFESMQLALPKYPRSKPYAQIPFQYSLHFIQQKGGKLEHREFLAESGPDPRRAIAEALCRDIPADVCVTAYNKSFECGRLEELAQLFPDLAAHLRAIKDNIKDLLKPFQSGYYYTRDIGGSFSIKSVLPALFPGDPELDYHALEQVQNGTMAMELFPLIETMSPADRKKARKNLLAYCKLDTYAMVKVWQKLCESVEET